MSGNTAGTPNGNITEAPELKPFGNPVSKTILGSVIGLGIVGLFMAVLGSLWGIPVFATGVIMLVFGLTKFSPDKPRTAGLLTRNGVPIKGKDGKGYVVGGITILMDYFPFFIGAIPIDITNQDKNFPMTATCKGTDDKNKGTVVLEGEVSVSLRPNINDLVDFVDAGADMKKIWDQLDDIVVNAVREKCKDKSWIDVVQNGKEIGDKVKEHVLDNQSFGVEIFKLQVVLNAPKTLVKSALQREVEMQERQSDNLDYETMRLAAQTLLNAFELDPKTKGKYGLDDCLKMIQNQHQIQQGRSFLMDSSGGNNTFNVASFNVPQNNPKGEKK